MTSQKSGRSDSLLHDSNGHCIGRNVRISEIREGTGIERPQYTPEPSFDSRFGAPGPIPLAIIPPQFSQSSSLEVFKCAAPTLARGRLLRRGARSHPRSKPAHTALMHRPAAIPDITSREVSEVVECRRAQAQLWARKKSVPQRWPVVLKPRRSYCRGSLVPI